MTRTVTVVTAVHAPAARYLPEAHASLADQRMPDGWDWQWVVQEDGETGDVAPYVPDDPRVSFGQGRRARTAIARTLALSRATGEFVRVLDADDRLTPGALARDIAALTRAPDTGWTVSRALDLLPDGSTVAVDVGPSEGPIARGTVLAAWRELGFLPPVHPATLCVRRDLLLALGGWMALPASEDTGLLLALDAVSPGWFTAEPGLLYRKWPGQVTASVAHADARERAARAAVMADRARALAELGWRAP
ncbi:glycosyltransferase family 2 protein [Nocardiopsis aegyptia]|uniref:Glycosyltransferase involved in cell wall biosynthesis n=1 Tax=Nocardiopsis aegyptia TaxID=220378 RepID=A0A7Z0J9I4_9ACTN|nr:glycosyltransferase [Nocardiopsis aegyptia]NYJ33435.1 glycosyltransferase involved in cell wall biosynthesis [Nocardiopsis aegyptia]